MAKVKREEGKEAEVETHYRSGSLLSTGRTAKPKAKSRLLI